MAFRVSGQGNSDRMETLSLAGSWGRRWNTANVDLGVKCFPVRMKWTVENKDRMWSLLTGALMWEVRLPSDLESFLQFLSGAVIGWLGMEAVVGWPGIVSGSWMKSNSSVSETISWWKSSATEGWSGLRTPWPGLYWGIWPGPYWGIWPGPYWCPAPYWRGRFGLVVAGALNAVGQQTQDHQLPGNQFGLTRLEHVLMYWVCAPLYIPHVFACLIVYILCIQGLQETTLWLIHVVRAWI